MKKNLCMVVAVAIAAALALAACAGKGQMTDKEVLMKIYEDLNGKNWGERFNKNWASELPLDEWYGVEVNEEGRVTKLSLSSDSVKGKVPAEIKYLTELKAFKVSLNNKDTTHDKAIPAEVWQLPHLKELRLYEYCGKGMQSEIPSEVNLPELELLYTNIQYADVAPLCRCATLATLSMSDFNGAIPEEIGQLTNLTELSLYAIEGLKGAVPSSIGKLTKLVKLEITADGKRQSGFAFPAAVWQLSGIKWLTLRNISGLPSQIPADKVGEMKQLTSISIIHAASTAPFRRSCSPPAAICWWLTSPAMPSPAEFLPRLARRQSSATSCSATTTLAAPFPPRWATATTCACSPSKTIPSLAAKSPPRWAAAKSWPCSTSATRQCRTMCRHR